MIVRRRINEEFIPMNLYGDVQKRTSTFRINNCGLVRIAFALFLLCTFIACSVRLIGDYDATIDQGVSDIQQRTELYLSKLQANPDTPYSTDFYDDINSRLTVLQTRASLLPKYPIISQQLNNLKSQFNDLQKLDKSMTRPVPTGTVAAAESGITVSVESILKLELALKRGQPAPPGSK